MKTFILVNAILELLAGVIFFLAPSMVPDLAGADASTIAWVRMYGAAATAVGILALHIWRNFDKKELHFVFLLTFLVFHIGVLLAGFIGANTGGMANPTAGILHSVMAAGTMYFFVKYKQNA